MQEQKILLNADINVTTNVRAGTVLKTKYGVSPNRIVSINHFFCHSEINKCYGNGLSKPEIWNERGVKIGFLGNLFKPPKVPGLKVVESIYEVNQSGLRVQLHIFGDLSELSKKAAMNSQNGEIVLHPRTSHIQSLKKLAKCDFFLLVLSDLPNCNIIMHSKLPHYIALGRPILAIVPEHSAVADIIRETGSGYVIPSTSNWGDELKKILRDFKGANP